MIDQRAASWTWQHVPLQFNAQPEEPYIEANWSRLQLILKSGSGYNTWHGEVLSWHYTKEQDRRNPGETQRPFFQLSNGYLYNAYRESLNLVDKQYTNPPNFIQIVTKGQDREWKANRQLVTTMADKTTSVTMRVFRHYDGKEMWRPLANVHRLPKMNFSYCSWLSTDSLRWHFLSFRFVSLLQRFRHYLRLLVCSHKIIHWKNSICDSQ